MHELLVANKDQVEVIFEEFSELEENDALGKRLDDRRFVTCEYQDKYNIPKTGRSSGPIAKATKTIKLLENSKHKKHGPTNKQSSSNSNTNTNDIEIAKREKLRKFELIDYEFQYQKEILDIEKQAKLANLHAQELANIEKEKPLGIHKELNKLNKFIITNIIL
ncbi:hypothetical protein C2G38_2028501 [Gigaspora rosea]|uniref:Uncharacterized protein n=1 Tax=Gigaspora rosea TaxID=44941 RepID=A0A397W153_9GLOM|nr:hypothetical protein C2G38_2028501 [Gigaspora rosea]